MKCPLCNLDLMIADRQGIEIDYCPKCRGVWLDRGELDKVLERSAAPAPQTHVGEYREPYVHHSPPAYPQEHDQRQYGHQKHKRKSFLQEVFDFD
jgi:uncharacterized protein